MKITQKGKLHTNVELKLKKIKLGGFQLINCKKCNIKCVPIYSISNKDDDFVCRDCALEIMKEYYDRRPDEIEETD